MTHGCARSRWRRWAGFWAARELPRPILLKTDCQGLDLEVLKGAGRRLRGRLDIVVMEANLFPPSR